MSAPRSEAGGGFGSAATTLRFKIGDAFPADDSVARFITVLALMSNDWTRSAQYLLEIEDGSEDEGGRWLSADRRRDRPEIASLSGRHFGSVRFGFADDVAVQWLPDVDTDARDILAQLRDAVLALARFVQRATRAYLETRPSGTFTAESDDD
jgi:hypothetical protein